SAHRGRHVCGPSARRAAAAVAEGFWRPGRRDSLRLLLEEARAGLSHRLSRCRAVAGARTRAEADEHAGRRAAAGTRHRRVPEERRLRPLSAQRASSLSPAGRAHDRGRDRELPGRDSLVAAERRLSAVVRAAGDRRRREARYRGARRRHQHRARTDVLARGRAAELHPDQLRPPVGRACRARRRHPRPPRTGQSLRGLSGSFCAENQAIPHETWIPARPASVLRFAATRRRRMAWEDMATRPDEAVMEARVARLESDVAHIRSDISEMKVDIRSLRDKTDAANSKLLDKIESVSATLDGKAEARAAALERKIDEKLSALDTKIEEKTSALDEKLFSLDKKIDETTSALDKKIDERTSALDAKIDERTSALDAKIDEK